MFLDCKPQTIIVLGDIMLDYTNLGSVNKLANEAPIPVFLKESETVSLGGCGNVLQNLASLGCKKLYLFSMCGNDKEKECLENLLNELNVEHHLVVLPSIKTTSKHRYFSNNKLLFRYDVEDFQSLPAQKEILLIDSLKDILTRERVDCILFSDYNKGFLTDSLCKSVIQIANEHTIFTCVDPKNNYTKYRNCSLIKPNRHEVEKLFGIKFSLDTLESVHKQIKKLVNCNYTVITLGDQGISGLFDNDIYFHWMYESKDVIDVTGAGDVVNAVLSFYFNQVPEKQFCLQLASYLATVSVSHIGAYKLHFNDILKAYKFLTKNKVIDTKHLKRIKKPLLFTNGCFDILHEGHLSLFDFCKSTAGDKYEIIVAVNSDSSISKLKGPTRPICKEKTRLAILNALPTIDWIVVLNEDTPEEILRELKPDLLVKGGDYTLDAVVGKEYCKKVLLFPFVHSISTSTILKEGIHS